MVACPLIIPSGSLSFFLTNLQFEDLLMRYLATSEVTPIDFTFYKKNITRKRGSLGPQRHPIERTRFALSPVESPSAGYPPLPPSKQRARTYRHSGSLTADGSARHEFGRAGPIN